MPLILELPDVGGQSGAGLVAVPAVAFVLGDPVPDLAVREPSVGLLLACVVESVTSAVYTTPSAKLEHLRC